MVEMVAGLIGVKLEKHYINLFTKDQLKEDYVKLNPRHKVPFIVDGDLKMNESRAIMGYLINKYKPDSTLYPKDPTERAKVDEFLYYDIGTLYPAGSKLFIPLLFGDANAPLDAENEKAYKDTLSYLEQHLAGKGKKFLLGDNLTVADISISTTISFAVHGCEYKIDSFPNLVSYMQRVREAIPDYGAINDTACENMRKFIQGRREGGK